MPPGVRLRPVSENHNVEEAKADLPRAALGALLHLSAPDGTAVACRTLRAVYELHGLDICSRSSRRC